MTKIVLTRFIGKSVLPQTLKLACPVGRGAWFSLISPFRVGVKNWGKSCEMEFCHVLKNYSYYFSIIFVYEMGINRISFFAYPAGT
jgi:hypothetical protein